MGLLRFLELPSLTLQPAGTSGGTRKTVQQKAESLVYQNRMHDAMNVISSHGVAEADETILGILRAMHPSSKGDLSEERRPESFTQWKA